MPRPSPPSRGVRRELRLVAADGLAHAVMVGLGEHYVAAFALALGSGETTAGLVAALPVLAGGLLQLVTPWGVHRLGSRRRWAVACATLQASAFLPLVAGALRGRLPTWLVFASAALYWACGMAAGAAWNAWVERVVPVRVRARFFARRTGAVYLVILVSLLAGGAVLDRARGSGRALAGFALLFGVAMTARLVSARLLAALPEPDAVSAEARMAPPRLPLPRRFPRGEGSRLLIYALALVTATSVASPYFSPYMLRRLELSYGGYTTLIGVALLARVLVMPLAARLVRRWGLVALLRAAWLGIAGLPAYWLFSDRYPYLMGLQLLSGVAWALHEYALFLLIFQTIASERRVAILTAYNLGDALVKVLGALAGALLFRQAGGGAAGYVTLFLASTTLRVVCLAFLARVHDAQAPERVPLMRPLTLRPGTGGWYRPLLTTLRRRERDPAGPRPRRGSAH